MTEMFSKASLVAMIQPPVNFQFDELTWVQQNSLLA